MSSEGLLAASTVDPTVRVRPRDRLLTVVGGDATLESAEAQCPSNRVITSTYEWWSFVPKNLFEQFQEYSNVYFFLIGVLQLPPDTTASGGFPDMWLTLVRVRLTCIMHVCVCL